MRNHALNLLLHGHHAAPVMDSGAEIFLFDDAGLVLGAVPADFWHWKKRQIGKGRIETFGPPIYRNL